MALFIPLLSLALGVASTTASVVQGQEAAAENKEANRLSKMQSRMTQARNIRRGIAASRVAQAQMASAGEVMGTAGGSAISGARAAESAQTAGGVGFAGTQQAMSGRRLTHLGRSDQATANANTFAGIGKLTTALTGYTTGQAAEAVWASFKKPEGET